jgi:LacI family transcriptional regulator
MKQVALEAGVSIAAVSKVLHGKGNNIRISEARAEEIRAVAKRLRYQPNVLARSLRMSRTHTVGLIWENMSEIGDGPLYYVHLLDGVASELFRKHYRLTILPDVPHLAEISSLTDGRLDGVIWCKMPDSPAIREELEYAPLQVVGLNASIPSHHLCPCVSCDNEGGAELVVDYLIGLGHRHILFVMDQGSDTTPDALARRNGFLCAMARHGIDANKSVVFWDQQNPEVAEWLKTKPKETAIFAWYEGLAGRVMAGAQAAGLQIPRDLSIVGFDSTIYCDSVTPRLTAVKQPIKEMAQTAARLLLDLIEGMPLERNSYVFPCSLDVRESTSTPALRANDSQ